MVSGRYFCEVAEASYLKWRFSLSAMFSKRMLEGSGDFLATEASWAAIEATASTMKRERTSRGESCTLWNLESVKMIFLPSQCSAPVLFYRLLKTIRAFTLRSASPIVETAGQCFACALPQTDHSRGRLG